MTVEKTLQRFIDAQAPIYAQVIDELGAGRKASHWMWFIFPQIAGLGSSATARHYAIADIAEARRYLDHPLLGERLRQCAELMLAADHSARDILGTPDDLKFRSSMTLFRAAATKKADRALFDRALGRFYDGAADEKTLALLTERR